MHSLGRSSVQLCEAEVGWQKNAKWNMMLSSESDDSDAEFHNFVLSVIAMKTKIRMGKFLFQMKKGMWSISCHFW